METVQIQCGSCRRLMAVQVEHLGSQVHCPHCQAIVQAPPARPSGPTADARGEHDMTSIFAGDAAEDIFPAGPRPPAVEMPPEHAVSFGSHPEAEQPLGAWSSTQPNASVNSGRFADGTTEASAPSPGRRARE